MTEKHAKPRVLRLPLKAEYFYAIQRGEKLEEYRHNSRHWFKRIAGRQFDEIHLTLGYPKKRDESRIIRRPWRGYEMKTITHPQFANIPVEVFAIKVN